MNKRKKQYNLIWSILIGLCVIATIAGIIFAAITKDYTYQNNNPKVTTSDEAPTYYYKEGSN